MTKATALLATIALSLSACAPKGVRPSAPWPGDLTDELLYWCKDEGRWPVYEKVPKHCAPENVSRGEWDLDRIPLSVNAETDLVSETLEAIDAMNDAVGFQLLVFSVGDTDPDISVVVAGSHSFAYAEAIRATIGGEELGLVAAYNGLESADRSDIILHELGHLMGLRHDDDKMSIMYAGGATRVAKLERQDVEVIRSLYADKSGAQR